MRYSKWISLAAAISLVVSCFMVWVTIDSRGLVLTGINTHGTNFGKPGYFHFFLTALFLIFVFTPKVWAKRWNILVAALNIGWALRNFFIMAGCSGGECPVRKAGMWIMLFSSILLLICSLFPDMELPPAKNSR